MVAIICGTNRRNSKSLEVASLCKNELETLNVKHQLIDLAEIEHFNVSPDMYNPDNLSPEIKLIQDQYIKPSSKWILIVPEYNGGIPGIFKMFIDILSIRDKDENFKNKDVLLIGVAAGRAGNLRGIDYLTNCLNYLGMNVHAQKLPLSSINGILKNGQLEEGSMNVLKNLISSFLK